MSQLGTWSASTITISGGTGHSALHVIDESEFEKRIKEIQEEIAELILLYDTPDKQKNVYEMSYDEYMQLPGNVRL